MGLRLAALLSPERWEPARPDSAEPDRGRWPGPIPPSTDGETEAQGVDVGRDHIFLYF